MRTRLIPLLTAVLHCSAWGQTYTISTFAGGALPVNIPGTTASLGFPASLAVDRAGNVFFVNQNTLLRLDASTGILTLVAGNGTPGFSGDNGPATNAQLNSPGGVAVDSAGNVYIADTNNQCVRKVTNGVIATVAGNGTPGSAGDNGPATSAQLYKPRGVAVDSAGVLYIADQFNFRVREVSNGLITTVAGGGSSLADNVPPTSAELNYPMGVAIDSADNLYIAVASDNFVPGLIREVSNGVITTVAGGGSSLADNVPATSAQLGNLLGVAVDSADNIYIADAVNERIRKVSNGVIATVAGSGAPFFSGDNGPATSAQLWYPQGVAVDSAGNLYIADTLDNRIREVSNGVITTVAGGGTCCFSGDNGPATSAQLYNPEGVAVDSAGNVYIADSNNYRVRKVSNGVIATVAGNGTRNLDPGSSGSNGPAVSVQLSSPEGVAVDSAGNLYIADSWSGILGLSWVSTGLLYKVSNGVITPVTAALNSPSSIAVDSAGNLYVADTMNNRILEISNGVITTAAGNGTLGFSGDNGPATSAQLASPQGVAVDSAGTLYIADFNNYRVRKVSNGIITTVAGNGVWGFSGDNGPATSAQLSGPWGIAVDSAGNLYVADTMNNRIRKVSGGVITTVAGGGSSGLGDNGPATSAQLYSPEGIAVDAAGNVYIADVGTNRIRILSPTGSSCTYSVSPTTLQAPASGGNLTVGIQTTASCPWAISGLPAWITASAASSGPGSASVVLAVFPNNSGATLNATVLIAGVSVTVTQPALATAPLHQGRGERGQLPRRAGFPG
jgi:sugar lactone lactonase YvrE